MKLSSNFSQNFLFERRLLAALLVFVRDVGRGDKLEISAATAIPTGKSSGKVEPMIGYAVAMGLIKSERGAGGVWVLQLTPLGEVVLQEDPYLSEPQTQWLLHLLLCRRAGLSSPPVGVAESWFALFALGRYRLGKVFTLEAAQRYLIERIGAKSYVKRLTTVTLQSYLEPNSLKLAEAVRMTEAGYVWQAAPSLDSYFPFYAVALDWVWEELFASERQVALQELERQSYLLTLLGWEESAQNRWLDWMVDRGIIQLDRQTGGALLLRLKQGEALIRGLYQEML